MNAAAEALARTILASGARRVAFVGLAKNVGKTTALVAALEAMHRLGVVAGTTSAGRDGEAFDAITGEEKPRFRVWPGQLIASAASTFAAASFAAEPLSELPFSTRFGPIALRRALGSGELEVIGPSTASEIEKTAAAVEAAGARVLLLDGAIARRAFAGARVADSVVLSAGLAAGGSLAAVVAAAEDAAALIRLGTPAEGVRRRDHRGALTDEAVAEAPPEDGEVLVVEDFTAVFLSPAVRRALAGRGVALAVRRPSRLLAVTANPTAPARPPLPAERLFRALSAAFPAVPVLDLVADLRSNGAP